MKEVMSSVDIAVVVAELQGLLGAKVEKAYQLGEKEIRLKLHHKEKGSIDLIIEAGRRIHITNYQRPSPRMPSNFSMFLRKHLSGGRISQIKQIDFDRIVEITVERANKIVRLIAELLPKGNIVLIDENDVIMLPLKRKSFSSRKIKVGEKYEKPPLKKNPLEITEYDLMNLFESSDADKEIVRTLASELSLGGLYAEEVCHKAGIDKKKKTKDVTEKEIKAIHKAMLMLFEPIITNDKSKLKAHIVLEIGKGKGKGEEEEKVDVLPFELSKYEGEEKLFFSSFNDAVDEFFTEKIVEGLEEKSKAKWEKGVDKFERILKNQQEALHKFKINEEECIKKGDLIYAHYNEIEEVLRKIELERDKDKIKTMVNGRGKKRKIITLTPSNTSTDLQLELDIDIDVSASLHKNASAYYEMAKTFRKKREGVEKVIEKTKEELRREKEKEVGVEEGLKPQKKREKKKKEWYESFRWFETTGGFRVLGGKDATTNEILVKKYMEDDDLFFHTQAEGAPVVIVKTLGEEVSEDDRKEVAQFAASYSNLWKYGFYEGECYFVKATQVSKTPESGEFIKKGSFVVRGKRNYFKVELGLCIGRERNKDRLIVCPSSSSLKDKMEYFVELKPGGELGKNEFSKIITGSLVEMAKEEDKEMIKQIVTQEEIMSFLPPGKSRIVMV